jgi:hypothetical protein
VLLEPTSAFLMTLGKHYLVARRRAADALKQVLNGM